MTSLAFILGVVPLVVASGAGAASRHSIGTGVFGGMFAATILSVLFVPLFFVLIRMLGKPGTGPVQRDRVGEDRTGLESVSPQRGR
jgi:HAE1 family hydrophobic/amphiphilic exporter-1/multidrug efflux pump